MDRNLCTVTDIVETGSYIFCLTFSSSYNRLKATVNLLYGGLYDEKIYGYYYDLYHDDYDRMW